MVVACLRLIWVNGSNFHMKLWSYNVGTEVTSAPASGMDAHGKT